MLTSTMTDINIFVIVSKSIQNGLDFSNSCQRMILHKLLSASHALKVFYCLLDYPTLAI